jgi:ribosomal subunit interface protein
MAVGDALRAKVDDEIKGAIGKYFERGGDAEVVFSKDGHSLRADCAVVLATGQQLLSHGLGGDAHAAFSQALAKVEARIRRYKGRLKSHSLAASAKAAETAAFYVLRAPAEDVDEEWDDAGPGGPPAALMELDLTGAQAIVFRNAAHGGLSVVYRRADGNFGWIDPERTRASAH